MAIIGRLLDNDSPLVIYKCINALLFYGKSIIVNHIRAIEYVIANLNSEEVLMSSTKYYVVQSILEVG